MRAVTTADFAKARALSLADGEGCEPPVFELLCLWGIRASLGLPIPFPMEGHHQ